MTIAEFTPGQQLNRMPLLVANCEVRQSKAGRDYIVLQLSDRSGSVKANLFNVAADLSVAVQERNPAGQVLAFTGQVEDFNGHTQVKLAQLGKLNPMPDPAEFLPASRHSLNLLHDGITDAWEQIEDERLRLTIRAIFEDYPAFFRAPAAFKMHHAWIGGLAEHTLGVLETALHIIDRFPGANRDVLIAGALLHDFGKLREYRWETGIAMNESDLLGHVSYGLVIAGQYLEGHKVDPDLTERVLHCIASHHGEIAFGAPVRPRTPEALILHLADGVDAKMTHFQTFGEHR